MRLHKALLPFVGAALIAGGMACQDNEGLRSTRAGADPVRADQKKAEDSFSQARDSQKKTGITTEGEQTLIGKVTQASADSITVEANGQTKLLKVDNMTSVMLDGQRASPSQLPPGADVRASYRVEGREQRALRIEVTSTAPRGANDPGQAPAARPSSEPGSTGTTGTTTQPDSPSGSSTGGQPTSPTR